MSSSAETERKLNALFGIYDEEKSKNRRPVDRGPEIRFDRFTKDRILTLEKRVKELELQIFRVLDFEHEQQEEETLP